MAGYAHDRTAVPTTMRPLPTGTVTFVLTDIEGSTALWEAEPQAMAAAVARHEELGAETVGEHGGVLLKHRGEGDSLFVVFSRAVDALAAACALQRSLLEEAWPTATPLRVRVALHTGDASLRGGDYFGGVVNRCARLRAAAYGGQVLLSQATQELVRDDLPPGIRLRDLGEHRLKDLTRPERIFQAFAPRLAAEFPAPRSLDLCRHNLPAQPTDLIGREEEVATLRRWVCGERVRLVTLRGPGGTGKTRLALQVGAELLDQFPEGVFLVSLAAVSDPDRVLSAIAQTLGVAEESGGAVSSALKDYLRAREMLLLLDNFEQVAEAAAGVAELLAGCPRLQVLATSRTPLHLRGEREFHVPPLRVPDARQLPPLAELSQYAAVELFIQRALDVRPSFRITNENAPAVAQICVRLDGLPLAIELAAARMRVLSPDAVLSRLDDRLKLLTGGARDLPARHQTLRNTIAWSHDLLDPGEQRLFRRLAVFAGSWSLPAAEEVYRDGADVTFDALDGLSSLVEKSLVRQTDDADGQPRFWMLESIRAFAAECLDQCGERAAMERRHVDHFLQVLLEADVELVDGTRRGACLTRLERDLDNFRAMLSWADREQAADVALRGAILLGELWWVRGYLTEGRASLQAALTVPCAEDLTALRLQAISGVAAFAWQQGDFTAAQAFGQQALAGARALGDRILEATALNGLGNVAAARGEYVEARARYEASLEIRRKQDRPLQVAAVLHNLGNVCLDLGEHPAAGLLYEECLAIGKQTADPWLVSRSLYCLGLVADALGDCRGARELLEQSLRLKRELGDRRNLVLPLRTLGEIECRAGDLDRAAGLLQEALAMLREMHDLHGIAHTLVQMATLALQQQESARSARLLGAAEGLREVTGAPLAPAGLPLYNQQVESVRAALGASAFEAAWAEGRSMDLEQVLAEALGPPRPPR